MKNTKPSIFLIIFCVFVLFLTIRGIPGNPTAKMLNLRHWRDDGPLELSPERGRYALTYSIIEDRSLQFSTDLARFVIPDVGYINNNYTSIFAPAVSFIVMPGYVLGRLLGSAQIGAFAIIAIFALLNLLLIRSISIRIGAKPLAAEIAGIAFLFATPAFAYAVTLYQHHISTFFMLLSIYILLKSRSFLSLFITWMIVAFSVTVDNPNFFMMLPAGLFAAYRSLTIEKVKQSIKIKLPLIRALTILGVVLPIAFFLTFNYISYDNPLQLPGTIQRITKIDKNGKPVLHEKEMIASATNPASSTSSNTALAFFKNRNITEGMYTFFLSHDRGMIIYTPVILLGFVGFILAARRKNQYASLFFSILCLNLLIYAMWGDPYGGWAFGARYLIPGYAILAIFISLLLSYWNRKILFMTVFFSLLTYSISVNTLGAITSNKNPPMVEAIAIQNQYKIHQPYSYDRNIELLNDNHSKSFAFTSFAGNYINAWGYFIVIVTTIVTASGIGMVKIWMMDPSKQNAAKTWLNRGGFASRKTTKVTLKRAGI